MKNLMKRLNQRPIAHFPIYRDVTGSTTAGLLLSQLMYWFSLKDKIFKTDADIREETRLTENELRLAKKIIKKLGFINVSREGLPAKTYYEINWEKYTEILTEFANTVVSLNPQNLIGNKIESNIKEPQENNELTQTRLVESTKLDKLNPQNLNCGIHQTYIVKSLTENTTETTTKTTLSNEQNEIKKAESDEDKSSKKQEQKQNHITLKSFDQFVNFIRANYQNREIIKTTDKYSNKTAIISVTNKGMLYNKVDGETYQAMRAQEIWQNFFKLYKKQELIINEKTTLLDEQQEQKQNYIFFTSYDHFVNFMRANYQNKEIIKANDKSTNEIAIISVNDDGMLCNQANQETYPETRAKEIWQFIYSLYQQDKLIIDEEITPC